eukprot:Sdes_comp19807_c0_seq4m11935
MGSASSTLSCEDIAEIETITGFDANQVKKLYRRFKQLDKGNIGEVTAADFMAIPELAMNPLVTRIITLFEQQNLKRINFKLFAKTLSVFIPNRNPEAKLKLAFEIYDIDNDGFISPSDLLHVLKLMVGANISDEQLLQLVKKTIQDIDVIDCDGSISYEEFLQVGARFPAAY